MSYQAAVNIIRDTAVSVNPAGFFVHGRRSDVTTHHDKPMPQIFLLPLRHTTDLANDVERFTVTMGFFRQDTPETSEEQREEIIAEMDVLSSAFVSALYEFNTIQMGAVTKTPEYRQFAGTLSGYGISFELIMKTEC